ncbi:hypothetical protein AB0I28_27245 [Phytomonospora sp. NPDC050363]|uniref:hypothetical protein n=1 Tax=Phytomonospora sp. NPDC050363 TaxID=3155642 RepID=UPI0033D0D3CD
MKLLLTLWRCGPLVAAAALAPVPFALTGATPWTLPLALAALGLVLRFGSRAWVDRCAVRLERALLIAPPGHRWPLRARAVDIWEVRTVMHRRFGLVDAVRPGPEETPATAVVHFALSTYDKSAHPHTPGELRVPVDASIGSAPTAIMGRCPDDLPMTRSSR